MPFNGKTWVVAIVSIVMICLVSLSSSALLGYLIWLTKDIKEQMLEAVLGIPGIVKMTESSITRIFQLLTKRKTKK